MAFIFKLNLKYRQGFSELYSDNDIRLKISYQRFEATPIVNKRLTFGRSHLSLLSSKNKFLDMFNTAINVCSVCHNFSKLLLSCKFPGRAFRSHAELQGVDELAQYSC